MSQENVDLESAIRRDLGRSTRHQVRSVLRFLANALESGEEVRLLALCSHPPIVWTRSLVSSIGAPVPMGVLMATSTRLVFVESDSDNLAVVPLRSIRKVDAKKRRGAAILTVETDDRSLAFRFHGDQPKRSAAGALDAFDQHVRRSLGAAGLSE
jgi:hypothetical protein